MSAESRPAKPQLVGERLERVRRKWLTLQRMPLDTVLSCDTCADNATCPSRFDAYNTNGDCLEEK